MPQIAGVNVAFVAGFGPLVKDPKASKAFYLEALGLPLEEMADNPDYCHSEKLDGVRHFALWPLAQAAQSCFGLDAWPADTPEPHSWLEFDVDDVAAAGEALKARGYRLLVEAREEPWGQTVARLLSPEGILVGLTYTPWLR
ncbi:catechol 2,3-dioxygenase-like lactoylglutathione lyase family enzyme [Caulobacter ginsengisoli]|uniref:Catechol 2,3-dioxygenase-like lactoylglutathione lyase family enzyme n=1 Tax=Caulobacter ginsengisoli TaxID=400775 RepID=A0ABU0IKC1_9CAUL|nr:VOC family protein [Caulobacter ginsengisoli]MDQ0462461.1 catechol 2,3-dioxygenase-like lactoylglutathione lyase family enzyme [Caulobacter ginsengisoli]